MENRRPAHPAVLVTTLTARWWSRCSGYVSGPAGRRTINHQNTRRVRPSPLRVVDVSFAGDTVVGAVYHIVGPFSVLDQCRLYRTRPVLRRARRIGGTVGQLTAAEALRGSECATVPSAAPSEPAEADKFVLRPDSHY